MTQLPGALFATLACGVLSYGFHLYVDVFVDVNVLYGSIATVVLFLYWMYFIALILIIGGFINRLLLTRRQEKQEPLAKV